MNIKRILSCCVLLLLSAILIFSMISCEKVENLSVGKVRLNIETYAAGEDQPTHPAIISFDKEWNGYKYWMVYTPYPEASGEEENPSIAVSNDLYKWETPYGMTNPIADNEETGCAELKDAHILYRDDLGRIEVWYLGRVSKNLGGDGEALTLFRKYSYDGILWSSYEIMDTVEYLSPTIRWNGSKYQMWSIGFDTYNTSGTFVYQESGDGENWISPVECSIEGENQELKLWHGAVSYDEIAGKYIFVYIQSGSDSQTIEACESDDGIHFSKKQSVVENDKRTLWNRFYRPCLLIETGETKYHLFYGVITEDNKWYISYSKGNSLLELKGITEKDCSRMIPLDSEVNDTNSFGFICKKLYHVVCSSLRPEIGILTLLLLFVNKIINKKNRQIELLMCIFCKVICIVYSYIIFKPEEIYALFGVCGAGIIEGFCVYSVATVIHQSVWENTEM